MINLQVFGETDEKIMTEKTNFYCIMFAGIGVVAGAAQFLQVI